LLGLSNACNPLITTEHGEAEIESLALDDSSSIIHVAGIQGDLNDFILVDIGIKRNTSVDAESGDESSFVEVKIPYLSMSMSEDDDVSLIKVNWLNTIKSNNHILIRAYTNRPRIEQAPTILNKIESYLVNSKLSPASVVCLIKLYKEEWLKY
jgi:hypothetical protein